MTVAELIKRLKECPKNYVVVDYSNKEISTTIPSPYDIKNNKYLKAVKIV